MVDELVCLPFWRMNSDCISYFLLTLISSKPSTGSSPWWLLSRYLLEGGREGKREERRKRKREKGKGKKGRKKRETERKEKQEQAFFLRFSLLSPSVLLEELPS